MDFDENDKGLKVNDEEFRKNQDAIIEQINDLSITTHNKDLIAMYNDVVELEGDIIKKEKIKAVDISEITKYISKKYSTEHNNKLFSALLDAIGRGNNKLSQNMLEQTLDINADWVDAIQDGIIAMQKIVAKPKLALREERDLVKVERAKRVDAVAVRHLSTHTQFIKMVRDDGSVVPSNIMTRNLEDELAIYENRFIYALLQRLKSFVGKRYNVIMEHAKIKDNIALSYTSNFKYGRAEIDCRLNVGVKMDKEMTQTQEKNIKLLDRLKFIKDQITALEASPFMRSMRKAKPLLPPIQRTNILKSNPEYSLCYNLWILLSNYNTVGYAVSLMEKQLPFDEAYYKDLTKIAATSAQVMLINNKVREAIYAQTKPTKIVQKEFKVKRSSSFLTNVFSSKRRANMKDINDFYYQRMKSMILNLSDLADALSVSSERDIPKKSLFKSIFKQVQQINNDMYTDILKLECLESDKKEAQTLQEKYEMQKKLCERYNQLTQLKQDEVKKALAEENAQLKKLEQLEKRMEKQKLAEKLKAEKAKAEQKNVAKQKKEELKKAKELEKQRKLAEIKKEKEKALAKLKKEKEKQLKEKEKAKKLLIEKREKEKKALQAKKEKEKVLLAKKKEKAKKLLAQKREKEKQIKDDSNTKKVMRKKAVVQKVNEEKTTTKKISNKTKPKEIKPVEIKEAEEIKVVEIEQVEKTPIEVESVQVEQVEVVPVEIQTEQPPVETGQVLVETEQTSIESESVETPLLVESEPAEVQIPEESGPVEEIEQVEEIEPVQEIAVSEVVEEKEPQVAPKISTPKAKIGKVEKPQQEKVKEDIIPEPKPIRKRKVRMTRIEKPVVQTQAEKPIEPKETKVIEVVNKKDTPSDDFKEFNKSRRRLKNRRHFR